mmetsp:Transcript_19436/g.58848  ORF Transcript_19436/g.58848 Transcript_19436/m.58848 type:complete len:126 (+) Transcript_19436:143-520(+)
MRSVFFFSAVVGVTAFAPQRLPAFGCPVCGGGDACVCGLPLTTAAATRRGRGGKIYIGDPEPLEELIDTIGGVLGNLGRGLGRVEDAVFGPKPVAIPIPIDDGSEAPPSAAEEESFEDEPYRGTW